MPVFPPLTARAREPDGAIAMGSQNVTNFREARKREIQSRVLMFDPAAADAGKLAGAAGAVAISSLAPKGDFAKTLTSKSVRVAANTIADLVGAVRREIALGEASGGEALARFGVNPADPQPYASLSAGLRRKFNEDLNVGSRKTDSFASAADAIGGTLLDVIAAAFPSRKEPSEVSREELRRAIGETPDAVYSRVFVKHVLASLLRQTFDATRGKIPRRRIDELMKALEPRIANMAARLTEVDK